MSRFEGKVVIVTGSSSGIGQAILLAFFCEGAYVVLHGSNTERIKNTEKLLIKNGAIKNRYLVVQGEIQDEAIQDKIINETVTKFGKIDVLINNAGVGIKAGADPLSMENFDYVMNVNYRT